ncbi:MAG TPA: DUF1343 domain-containing protein [Opitutaceae bacterium]|nr:DUF1343 domain-containing protein [Opitutaceae bacterium]
MPGGKSRFAVARALPLFASLLAFCGCSGCHSTAPKPAPAVPPPVAKPAPPPPPERIFPVMLGIDALEADGFAAVKGKRIGLLTHPAAVNRRGVSTIEVLRHAPGVQLVALYAVEHGIYGDIPAGKNFGDQVDKRTGLPVFSLYTGKSHRPSKEQLKSIDALVVDLQDIGTRSYTFISAMKEAMEGCFENGKEIVVLDRPNPLGGLKVDGPLLDAALVSYVGAFRVPYVHGLTIGELARMAAAAPGVLTIPDAVRTRGKLVVVPMRGWTRSMRWPDTGLAWVATSPKIPDFSAVEGYPMTGLGCEPPSGFRSGVGEQFPFRGLSHLTIRSEIVEKELRTLNIPGVQIRRIAAPNAKNGSGATGLFVEISDWDAWRPTELNFWLMKLTCKLEGRNPYATAKLNDKSLFTRLVGSSAFVKDLATKGKNIDLETWFSTWREQAKVYQEQSRKYWLYW